MGKPTILTVDDDPQVSQATTRDLRSRHDLALRVHRGGAVDRVARSLDIAWRIVVVPGSTVMRVTLPTRHVEP
jgi:hypothetical protein